MMKSIVLPNSKIIFEEKLYDEFNIGNQKFNLIDWNGMFLTKIDSCQKQKRERDSFDIYLAFANNGLDIKYIRKCAGKYESINKSIDDFRHYLRKNRHTFNENVKQYSHQYDGSPAEEILRKL